MMQQLHEFASRCLFSSELESKQTSTHQAWQYCVDGQLSFHAPPSEVPLSAAEVVFPDGLIWVSPRELPQRKLSSPDGLVAFIHAIAHIEFVAIHLAWDMAYRFRGLPDAFYRDWLSVAVEEVLHFSLLRQRLQDLGSDYGALPVHKGLWDIAEATENDLLARLALVPRFMEARGLDVTPAMIAKLEALGDEAGVEILQRILTDEVGHVAIGSHWFDWLCQKQQLEPEETYFRLLEPQVQGRIRGPFNHALRRQAGFTEAEIQRLETYS